MKDYKIIITESSDKNNFIHIDLIANNKLYLLEDLLFYFDLDLFTPPSNYSEFNNIVVKYIIYHVLKIPKNIGLDCTVSTQRVVGTGHSYIDPVKIEIELSNFGRWNYTKHFEKYSLIHNIGFEIKKGKK